jgi:hypothetical protein
MNQTAPDAENVLLPSQNIPQESASGIPGYWNCLTCADLGATCNGPSLRTLGDIATVRTFHKEIRKTRSITLRAIYKAAPQISETTINEYFSNAVKDFKWTTVSHIDHALLSICGNRVGLPPLDHACPASSSDVRNQLAAADLKLAAAELRAAQSETDLDALRQKLADTKGKHIAQLAQLESAHEKDLDWMKDEVRLWRRFAFLLLGVGLILLIGLVFYIGWDVAHPASGLIRY